MDGLESIEQASNNLLSKGIKEDTPTGSTPRKRKWQYVDDWSLTASRNELLSSRSEKEKENLAVEPEVPKVGYSKPEDIENVMQPTEAAYKAEEMKAGPVPLEPLVDSRRRNTTRTTRRAR
jgi:kinesin family protein 11